jgi:methylenetetrahydrofolate dehydrogenase (NADP+)/methenyltetrahydrofolate cyclohydrolase
MTVVMGARDLFEKILSGIRNDVKTLQEKSGVTPGLAAILVGDDPVSQTYVSLKEKDCERVGIVSRVYRMFEHPPETRETEVLNLIRRLNSNSEIHGVLIQLPFPDFVNREKIFENLAPQKDVDGLTPYNLGKLLLGEYILEDSLIPCTPKGAIRILDHFNVPIEGKNAVIVGRSVLVGEPLRKLLQDRNATATCTHRHTTNLSKRLMEADIIVTASGRPPEIYERDAFRLTGEMVKDGVTVVSIGVRRNPVTGKLVFDVDFDDVKDKAAYITPNTGSTGIMTRAMLLQNTIAAAKRITAQKP